MNFFGKKNYPVIVAICVICVAYLPLLSGFFSIKFDALYYYYPVHFFFSEQLQSGSIPLWFYNLNGGFPMHADVGTPFWNFTLWLFPLLGKSVYVFTLSMLSHVALAAFGMYKLARHLQLSNGVASVLMVCYVCSGYYAAHLTHPPYIFEIAYIPFILLFFLRTVYNPNFKNSIWLGISLFFLINSGYPGFCIATLYFLIAFFIAHIVANKALRNGKTLWKVVCFLSLACTIGAVLSLPLFVSYMGIANNYNHSDGYSLTQTFTNYGGMTVRSLLSFLWPFASPLNADFYKTDATWNNIYCGIILICFAVVAFIKSKHKMLWPLVICGLLLLVMSFQGGAKIFFFKHLPLLSLLRNNGGFRIFFVLTTLLAGGFGLQYVLDNKAGLLKKIAFVFIGIQLLTLGYLFINHRNMLFGNSLSNLSLQSLNVNTLSIPFMVFVQSIISIALLLLTIIFIKNKNKIVLLIYADIVLSFLVNLPFTGINARHSASQVQAGIANSAAAINNAPANQTLGFINAIPYDTGFLNEPVHFFKNNIGFDEAQYPSMLKNYSDLLYSGKLKNYDSIQSVFLVKQTAYKNGAKDFLLKNNSVSFSITSAENDSVVIFQNYHQDWKGYVDDKEVVLGKNEDGFIRLPISAGTHQVLIKYWPSKAVMAFFISLLVWFGLVWFLVKDRRRRKSGALHG